MNKPAPSFALRHEWTTTAGDDLAVVIEDSGVSRLIWLRPPREELDQQPREWGHALLALVADLLRERDRAKAAIEALEARGADERAPAIWCAGFGAAKAAALALLEPGE